MLGIFLTISIFIFLNVYHFSKPLTSHSTLLEVSVNTLLNIKFLFHSLFSLQFFSFLLGCHSQSFFPLPPPYSMSLRSVDYTMALYFSVRKEFLINIHVLNNAASCVVKLPQRINVHVLLCNGASCI